MDSSQDLQLLVSDGLQSDTQAADSLLAICNQAFSGDTVPGFISMVISASLSTMNVSRTASNMENTCARNKEGGVLLL